MESKRQLIHDLADQYEWAELDPIGEPVAPNIHCPDCKQFIVVDHPLSDAEDLMSSHHQEAHDEGH